MTMLGPMEVLLIAAIGFHVILIAELGARRYLWLRVLCRRLLHGRLGGLMQLTVAVLVLDAMRPVHGVWRRLWVAMAPHGTPAR